MGRYLAKHLLYLLPVMLGVSIVTFGLIDLTPGDPVELILRSGGVEPTREAVAALREELGLNDPVYIQSGRWLWNAAHLNLGKSFRTGRPVAEDILSRFPATLELTCAALAFMVCLTLPAGILSALYRHAFLDHGKSSTRLPLSPPLLRGPRRLSARGARFEGGDEGAPGEVLLELRRKL